MSCGNLYRFGSLPGNSSLVDDPAMRSSFTRGDLAPCGLAKPARAATGDSGTDSLFPASKQQPVAATALAIVTSFSGSSHRDSLKKRAKSLRYEQCSLWLTGKRRAAELHSTSRSAGSHCKKTRRELCALRFILHGWYLSEPIGSVNVAAYSGFSKGGSGTMQDAATQNIQCGF